MNQTLAELYDERGTVLPWPVDLPLPMPGQVFACGPLGLAQVNESHEEWDLGKKRRFVAVTFYPRISEAEPLPDFPALTF